MTRGALVDTFGREIGDLRISVTDRCNLRCHYCMPAEGLAWAPKEEELEFAEIERLVSLFAELGVRSVRLTGGEPLVRRGLPELVERIAAIHAIEDISLTTNGILLESMIEPLIDAGLTRVNVSLDALTPERYREITRRNGLQKVLSGLAALERYPQLGPIKVNVVAVRGMSDLEILGFAELARRKPYVVRFLEFMPLDADEKWSDDVLLTGAEIRRVVESVHDLVPLPNESAATSSRFAFADNAGELGFVSPVSEPFCGTCDRARLTADGQLRTCLFALGETDLRGPMRDGVTNGELEDLISSAIWRKPIGHQIGNEFFTQPGRSMSQIGG
ncbi:MAG: GTP 3',8-cyclase MoaA [Solirubrobacterales bacterium]|nr:GTP 3',8-cyclase MoaA [Solirubrobacterales bacterium]